ncbi:triosephosphate isomerase [Streptomyces sp. 110]|uniref:Triosephosphate isomerase n=1 Tax=Streptomyces endocoffeicus TaxID=2898945 RepID=A0ABS1PXN3_9ACTN|nr:triose-phosphate isomerase family protein [Streptomyces endocoffeicus]MBL1117196.1 triosephosphate isomerase [Streptomyces endocoffeicus]
MSSPHVPSVTIGVSLKMYFGHHQTLNWCRRIAAIAERHPAVTGGLVETFVLPSFPALVPAAGLLAGTGVRVGAQDLSAEEPGAFTGEVSGAQLREIGCGYAEVGHAERRRLFHEDETVVAAKTAAALRHGLTPVLCVGEPERADAGRAAERCAAEVESALAAAGRAGVLGPVIVAYEPQWAIGAPEPASPEHIRAVCTALSTRLAERAELAGSRVVYGGSAGPGLLTRLGPEVGGLFLGRFAHDPGAFEAILDEAAALHGTTVAGVA